MNTARSIGYAIAVSALFITIPRYIAVLNGIDDWAITAWGMGILLGGGAAYIFHAWAKTRRQDSWRLLVAFSANLAYEPIIVTPFVLSRLWSMPLSAVMATGYAVFWSFMVATAPIVLVGGVVLALRKAKISATAVSARSPPDRCASYCSRLPGGRTRTSTPV